MSKKTPDNEPYWAPLPRQRMSAARTAAIVVRHLIPLAGVWFFGGSAGQFLLLSVFGIGFSIACIGVIGVAVSTRKELPDTSTLDQVVSWIFLLLIGVVISLVLTAMFGWVIAIFAGSDTASAFNQTLVWSVLGMIACAAPDLFRQYQTDLRSPMTETERKQRDQPHVLSLVMCGGLIFLMSGYALEMGRSGLGWLAIGVTALFVFRDLRPDLMRELTRPSHRPPGT